MTDLISIVIPTYNSEKTIKRALNSVLNQSYKKWEAIIIDSYSTDKTIELISNDRENFFKSISPPDGGLLISLHNNIREYSIDNEIPLSTEVSIKNTNHPHHHNFFICTNKEDYDLLKKSPFNVVLQDKQIENDDGSLSWYAYRKNIRYINIETRLGHLRTQSEMLKYVNDNLF